MPTIFLLHLFDRTHLHLEYDFRYVCCYHPFYFRRVFIVDNDGIIIVASSIIILDFLDDAGIRRYP